MFTKVTTGFYPELCAYCPHLLTLYFLESHSNIIFPSMPRSYKWSLPFEFSDQNFVLIFHLSHACYLVMLTSYEASQCLVFSNLPASLLGTNILIDHNKYFFFCFCVCIVLLQVYIVPRRAPKMLFM